MLFEPNDQLSVRLIGDYTHRNEKCCGAVYVDNSVNSNIGNLNEVANPLLQPGAVPARTNDSGNNIVNVLRDLGQNLNALHSGYAASSRSRRGASYEGKTKDWGLSGQIDYDFGAATLTSITAYRDYDVGPGRRHRLQHRRHPLPRPERQCGRHFKTFSQELRLQGKAFGGKLDWLVGGYYANEDLTLTDNLRLRQSIWSFRDLSHRVAGRALGALFTDLGPRASPLVQRLVRRSPRR